MPAWLINLIERVVVDVVTAVLASHGIAPKEASPAASLVPTVDELRAPGAFDHPLAR